MAPSDLELNPNDHHPALGILAGLAMAFAVWMLTVIVVFTSYPSRLAFSLLLLPPAAPIWLGATSHRNGQPRFAIGLFIAGALVFLVEGTCASLLMPNLFR